MATGHLMFYLGLATSPTLAVSGVMLVLVGWGAALVALTNILLRTPHPDKRLRHIWLACYGVWAFKYAPYYWRPRVDGRDG